MFLKWVSPPLDALSSAKFTTANSPCCRPPLNGPLHRQYSHPPIACGRPKVTRFWDGAPYALASNQGGLTLLAIPQPPAPCSQPRTPPGAPRGSPKKRHGHPSTLPPTQAAASIRPGCCAVLAATRVGGARRASHAVPSMAIPSGPCCQIRALVMHVYPDGIKAYGHERHTVPLGRRGKPVKKMRFIPAERAHVLARKLQGRFGTTVSVL
jgi:hypothetical protein